MASPAGYVDAVRAAPGGGKVAAAISHLTGNSWKGELHLLNADGSVAERVETQYGIADCAWVGASRASVATASDSGDVYLWQRGAASLEQIAAMEDHDNIVSCLATVDDQPNQLVSGSWDHT